jgi:hypothetical protein
MRPPKEGEGVEIDNPQSLDNGLKGRVMEVGHGYIRVKWDDGTYKTVPLHDLFRE